jgi:hypothetical protein
LTENQLVEKINYLYSQKEKFKNKVISEKDIDIVSEVETITEQINILTNELNNKFNTIDKNNIKLRNFNIDVG